MAAAARSGEVTVGMDEVRLCRGDCRCGARPLSLELTIIAAAHARRCCTELHSPVTLATGPPCSSRSASADRCTHGGNDTPREARNCAMDVPMPANRGPCRSSCLGGGRRGVHMTGCGLPPRHREDRSTREREEACAEPCQGRHRDEPRGMPFVQCQQIAHIVLLGRLPSLAPWAPALPGGCPSLGRTTSAKMA